MKIPKNASEAMSLYFQQNVASQEDVFTLDNGFSQNISPPHDTHCHMDVVYISRHNLCDVDARFVGIIREPLERLLSLYLYRCRQNRYGVKPSPEDFRKRAAKGFIEDHPWQMQLQSTFLSGASNISYWCFDRLDEHVAQLREELKYIEKAPLQIVNNSSNINTKSLIDIFYDSPTRDLVSKYWARDKELYNEIKHSKT